MSGAYESAAAFRQALEARLARRGAQRGLPRNTLRQMVIMERLLARLFAEPHAPWLLKGGYAMELRFRPRARTTRDLDLSAQLAPGLGGEARHDAVLDALRAAAERVLGDHLVFQVHGPGRALTGAPRGGWRFRTEARLAGKPYGGFHVDVGLDDPLSGEPERLSGEDHLAFAGIPPAVVLAIPRTVQFAEKVHAYTRRWTDRVNTRTKDLVDLMLLIEAGLLPDEALTEALRRTFHSAGAHRLPDELPGPPADWRSDFAVMARSAELEVHELDEAFHRLSAFWARLDPRG